jgi:hypothetical protein
LIRRTRHRHEESLTVILQNGKKFSEPFQPITNLTDWPAVQDKFAQSVRGAFSQERTVKIIDHINHLEELPAIDQLTDLLRTN